MDCEKLNADIFELMMSHMFNDDVFADKPKMAKLMADSIAPINENLLQSVRSFTVVTQLPEEIWCLSYRSSNEYFGASTFDKPPVRYIVVMLSGIEAYQSIPEIDLESKEDLIPLAVTFSEINDIAKEQGIDALLLVDGTEDVKICYVH